MVGIKMKKKKKDNCGYHCVVLIIISEVHYYLNSRLNVYLPYFPPSQFRWKILEGQEFI